VVQCVAELRNNGFVVRDICARYHEQAELDHFGDAPLVSTSPHLSLMAAVRRKLAARGCSAPAPGFPEGVERREP
jgi:hypothetical protein